MENLEYKDVSIRMDFSKTDENVKTIVNSLSDVIEAACGKYYGNTNMVSGKNDENYFERMNEAKMALIKYSAKISGLGKLEDETDVAMAFANNQMFTSIFNSIVADALRGVTVRAVSPQIMAMANKVTVKVGNSYTWNIDTKGLPVAQRASYGDNVAILDSYANGSLTVTPKPYSIGTTIDYIRILANDYDLGKELARVTMGMLYAQYKLVKGIIYDTANVLNTPLHNATFTKANYVRMGSDLSMLNNSTGVTAYGTLVAFNTISALAAQGGFVTQDKLITDGYLGKILGIPSVIVDQATDLSAPFTTATAASLRLVPDNLIVMLSDIGDKPVKLVVEDFIRVKQNEANKNSLNRVEFSYSQCFEAGYVSQGSYGLQSTQA